MNEDEWNESKRLEGLENRFTAAVTDRLGALNAQIEPILEAVIRYSYPPEIEDVEFNVDSYAFTDRFPVGMQFWDTNGKPFWFDNSHPPYPVAESSPLLSLPGGVYEPAFIEPFLGEYPDLDTESLSCKALIIWFAERWDAAGGESFAIAAKIGQFDTEFDVFHLGERDWVYRG